MSRSADAASRNCSATSATCLTAASALSSIRPHASMSTSKPVATQSGKSFDYDYLVIATGSRIRARLVPGHGRGRPLVLRPDGRKEVRDALADFQGRQDRRQRQRAAQMPGRAARNDASCSRVPAANGSLDKFEITYTYPIGRLHALEPVAQWTVPEFETAGIKSENFFNTQAVDRGRKTITSEEGDTLPYDLLITIPPHRGRR